MTQLRKIGSPAKDVIEWLYLIAEENDEDAVRSIWPWSMKYRGRAQAFRDAAVLVRRAAGEPV